MDHPSGRSFTGLFRPPSSQVPIKFATAIAVAVAWTLLSAWLSARWMEDLAAVTHPLFALFSISFIAFVPGFMNAFLMTTLLLDRRPPRAPPLVYPGLTILIAAYQEAEVIGDTIASIANANYPGELEVLILSDGSSDDTVAISRNACAAATLPERFAIEVVDFKRNRGKAAVLNEGLARARHGLIVTIDGDTQLVPSALTNIVERLLADPPGTMAVAGAVLVNNADETLITGAQQWDYFHGIAAVKRMQSMYNGTLVAQGAFSIYRKRALEEVGGWPETVGEDIVLTWAMLRRGWRVGYAEDAVVFTNAPTTFGQFSQQRKRWSRGMVEALDHHEELLVKPRLTLMFIWWNLLFMPLDLVYTAIFIPGVIIAALLGIYWIAGPVTLAVLPLAGLWNLIIYRKQSRMLKQLDLKLDPSWKGLFFYLFVYTIAMQPVCVWGYASELLGRSKKWGTK
jgi:biofilm PGA synthesis N-glycosyltransferase PgaC